MAKLFIPAAVDSDLPVFYNVDAVVGAAPAANNREDVLLVQYLMRAHHTRYVKNQEARILLKTMPLHGVADQHTIAGIVKVQESVKKIFPTTIVDGRASQAKGYSYGASFYTIAILNEFVQREHYELWPRLDKMPEAPPGIRDLVFRTLVGGRIGPLQQVS
jgi:hypothetical protein